MYSDILRPRGLPVLRFVTLAVLYTALSAVHQPVLAQGDHRINSEADFERAMEELSNWGRWGADDELGASNLITPAKRVAAASLVTEGITVSLAHDVNEERAIDASSVLNREVLRVSPSGASDRYQYDGSYHGTIHSHLDSVDCHIMYEGFGYNGVSYQAVEAAGGCPQGSIHAQRNGIITRGILFDATLLPGRATEEGWLEPGTAIHYEDLLELERIQGVTVQPGDVILLYTGRWKRRAALGPWPTSDGVAGFHADVAYFLKERGVAFIGHDMWNDVSPSGVPNIRLPLHILSLVSLGVGIFDNLDFEEVAEVAKEQQRYEFLFMASPLRIPGGMGSPLNPIAMF